VGAPTASYRTRVLAGISYVVYGKTDGEIVRLKELGNAGYRVVGEAERFFTGGNVAAPGDMDGDGVPDLFIGAYNDHHPGGQSYLVWGRP
jgi:hypothetical protein